MGWNNDNFMDSLGKGQEDRERANDDYYRHARFGRPPQQQQPDASTNDDPLFQDEYDNDSNVPLPPTDGDLPSGDIAGAQLTEEMKAKIKASHTADEEASQGGQMFRKLLERAQQGPSRIPPPPPMYVPPPPPPAYVAPPPVAAVPPPQMPADFNSLSVEEQARLF